MVQTKDVNYSRWRKGEWGDLWRTSKESSFVAVSVCVSHWPPPYCHVLLWTMREFNSCDDVVHSTRLDYPLSPLRGNISFYMCLRVCDLGGCATVSQPGSLWQCRFIFRWNECLMFMCHLTVPRLYRPFKFLTKSQMKAQRHSDLCSLLIQSAFASFGKLITRILLTVERK